MSFSERAAVQELARGSDAEQFCAPVAFLNPTRGVQGHFRSHTAAKHHYVVEFYVSIFMMMSKQNMGQKQPFSVEKLNFCVGTRCNSNTNQEQQVHVWNISAFLNASIFSHPKPALAARDLELAAGVARGGRAQRGAIRITKSTRVGGEKTGPGFPFNLLINHANEILTGYSEVFLGGVWKALVPDYTLSMWRAEKK